jgi:protein-S-isoprenylcysteine O-methyltransferase Ste14
MHQQHASRPTAIPWPPVLFVASLVMGWLAGRLFPLPWPGIDDLIARLVGYGLAGGGIALMLWGLMTLYRAGTTVLPNKGADRLVTEGPFRYRRHPIYLADVLILLGLAQLTLNIWLAILAPVFAVAVFKLAIEPEERHLEERFGQAYLDYEERTRRWF